MSGSFIIQPRHRWMIQRISEGFGVSEASVEQSVRNSDNSKLFKHFLGANGPSRLFAFYQAPMRQSDENPGECKDHMHSVAEFVRKPLETGRSPVKRKSLKKRIQMAYMRVAKERSSAMFMTL